MAQKFLISILVLALSICAGGWFIEHERNEVLRERMASWQRLVEVQAKYEATLEKVTGACESSLLNLFGRLGLDQTVAPFLATVAWQRVTGGAPFQKNAKASNGMAISAGAMGGATDGP